VQTHKTGQVGELKCGVPSKKNRPTDETHLGRGKHQSARRRGGKVLELAKKELRQPRKRLLSSQEKETTISRRALRHQGLRGRKTRKKKEIRARGA